jgi:hypothetical protein
MTRRVHKHSIARYRDVTHLLPVLVFQRNPVPGVTAQSEEGEQKGVEEGRGCDRDGLEALHQTLRIWSRR